MKRAQSIQFNWIFIVISGSILLVFFTGFGIRYIDLQKSKENAEIARGIDKIINSLRGQEQYKEIDINTDFSYEFNCDSFKINDDYVQNLNGKIVFSPKEIKVKNLYVWTKEFRTLFKVDNLIFLVDPNKNIFLISDSNDENYVQELKNGIPSLFSNIKFVNFNDIGSLDVDGFNNEFVFFNLKEEQYDIIHDIGVDKRLEDAGEVIFINKENVVFEDGRKYNVLDQTLIYGAIFSGNYESYKCSYDSLVRKFNTIKDIYVKKAENLQKCCSSGFCDYSKIRDSLIELNLEKMDLNIVSINNDLYNNNCRVVF